MGKHAFYGGPGMTDSSHLKYFERAPTAETLAFHAAYIAQLRAKHPGIFSAPQPAALPPVTGHREPNPIHPFGAIREQAAAGTYRLRDPAASKAGLVSATSVGDCLAPVVQHGDTTYIDPTATPQHGDIVAVLFTPEALEYIAEFHRCKYGAPTPSPFAQKLLWNERGEWLLLTRAGSIPLASATVCGVIRRIERNGVSIYGTA